MGAAPALSWTNEPSLAAAHEDGERILSWLKIYVWGKKNSYPVLKDFF